MDASDRFVAMARRIIADAPARVWAANDGYLDSIRTSGEYSGKGWGSEDVDGGGWWAAASSFLCGEERNGGVSLGNYKQSNSNSPDMMCVFSEICMEKPY